MSGKEWLLSLGPLGMRLGLENISELLKRLGDPQNNFKSIHVAGSDGKGSTCAMLHSILSASGKRTGLYTSPHILEMNERIVVNEKEISDNDIELLVKKIRPSVEEMNQNGNGCTFFEVMTAMAFLNFSDKDVEYAVIETGLGGRFDATNVIIPEVSVITNISLEHTAILGDTIEKIACEKAGIIKNNVPVVTANTGSAYETISHAAREKNSKLIKVDLSRISKTLVKERTTSITYLGEDYEIGIPGKYQAQNAAVVIETMNTVRPTVSNEVIKKGLHDVRWGCRMERFGDVIVDVTHTAAGALGLAQDITEVYGKVILVFGVLDDKDADSMAELLSRTAVKIFITAPDSERAADASRIKEIVSKYHENVSLSDNVGKAIEEALSSRTNNEKILVTGSFYMAGDARKWLKKTYAGY